MFFEIPLVALFFPFQFPAAAFLPPLTEWASSGVFVWRWHPLQGGCSGVVGVDAGGGAGWTNFCFKNRDLGQNAMARRSSKMSLAMSFHDRKQKKIAKTKWEKEQRPQHGRCPFLFPGKRIVCTDSLTSTLAEAPDSSIRSNPTTPYNTLKRHPAQTKRRLSVSIQGCELQGWRGLCYILRGYA